MEQTTFHSARYARERRQWFTLPNVAGLTSATSPAIIAPNMDRITPKKRSWLMSLVRARNTKPERMVRSIVRSLGFRFGTYAKNLPGRPDLVLASLRKVIFVHGCFWHQHHCRLGRRLPASNRQYWLPKLRRNKERDARDRRQLRAMGFATLVVWECQIRNTKKLTAKIKTFLEQ